MSYSFEDMRYTYNPNTDLDFGNDILYTELIDNVPDTYNVKYNNGNEIPLPDNKDRKLIQIRQKRTNNIYVLLFIIMIGLLYWYNESN